MGLYRQTLPFFLGLALGHIVIGGVWLVIDGFTAWWATAFPSITDKILFIKYTFCLRLQCIYRILKELDGIRYYFYFIQLI